MTRCSEVLIYIVIGSVILLAISGGFSIWALRRSLRPLSELAERRGSRFRLPIGILNPPEEARDTLELEPLTQAMTSMLEGFIELSPSSASFWPMPRTN